MKTTIEKAEEVLDYNNIEEARATLIRNVDKVVKYIQVSGGMHGDMDRQDALDVLNANGYSVFELDAAERVRNGGTVIF